MERRCKETDAVIDDPRRVVAVSHSGNPNYVLVSIEAIRPIPVECHNHEGPLNPGSRAVDIYKTVYDGNRYYVDDYLFSVDDEAAERFLPNVQAQVCKRERE